MRNRIVTLSRRSLVCATVPTLRCAFQLVWNYLSFYCLLKSFTSFKHHSSSCQPYADLHAFPYSLWSSDFPSNIYAEPLSLAPICHILLCHRPHPNRHSLYIKPLKFFVHHDILKVLGIAGCSFGRCLWSGCWLQITILDIRDMKREEVMNR